MSKTVRVSYVGDASSLERATGRAERALAGIGRRGPRALSSVAKAAGIATVAVGGLAVVVGKKSLDAYIESEKVQRRFLTQLRATGVEASRSRKHIESWIDSRSKMSGFDDEDLTESFTGLLRATKDVDQATELLTLSMDIARGKGIDLAAANQLVIKANMGNVGALRRMGIDIKAVTKAQDELKASGEKYTKAQLDAAKAKDKDATALKALRTLSKQFKGQTDQFASSTAGSLAKAQVAWENLQETLGEKIAPTAKRVLDIFSKIATAPDLRTAIEIGLKAGKGLVSKLAEQLSSAWRSIDWSSVWSRAFSAASGIADKLYEQGKRIVKGVLDGEWDAVGEAAAAAIVVGIVGKKLGIGRAIGGAVDLLTRGRGGGLLGGAVKAMTVTAGTVIVNGGIGPGTVPLPGGKTTPVPIPGGRTGVRGRVTGALGSGARLLGRAAGFAGTVYTVKQLTDWLGPMVAGPDTIPGAGYLPGSVNRERQGAGARYFARVAPAFAARTSPVLLNSPGFGSRGPQSGLYGARDMFTAAVTNYATGARKMADATKTAETSSVGSFRKIAQAVGVANDAIQRVKPKTVDVKAKTNPRDVDAMRSKIDAVKGKTVPVRAAVELANLREFAQLLANLPRSVSIPLRTFSSGPGRASGGVIPGRYSDGDVHPAMLSGEEVVLNPTQQAMVGPGRIMAALNATGAPTTGFRFAKGKKKLPNTPEARWVSRKTPKFKKVPDAPPVGLRLALARAENQRDLFAQIHALRRIRLWWKRWLGDKISPEDRVRVLDTITGLDADIEQRQQAWRDLQSGTIDESGPAGDPGGADTGAGPAAVSEDTRAQLDQANRRLEASKRAGQLQSAFLGALGIGVDTATGGVTINLNGLTYPPSPDVITSLGRTVAQAVSGQAFQPSTAESLGV